MLIYSRGKETRESREEQRYHSDLLHLEPHFSMFKHGLGERLHRLAFNKAKKKKREGTWLEGKMRYYIATLPFKT